MIYYMSTCWKGPHNSTNYAMEVTRRHPLLVMADRLRDSPGHEQHALLWYHVISEQLGDIELQHYLDECLDKNYGEIVPCLEQPNDHQ